MGTVKKIVKWIFQQCETDKSKNLLFIYGRRYLFLFVFKKKYYTQLSNKTPYPFYRFEQQQQKKHKNTQKKNTQKHTKKYSIW